MRSILRALVATSFGLAATLALGQSYPNKPVRIVVPYPLVEQWTLLRGLLRNA